MVRATFAGFSTALSALQANQKRLDITGQNLANMNTTGYTRQQLKTSSFNYTNPISHYTNGSEISVGFGVKMEAVTQIRDPYLDAQYRSQMSKSSYTDSIQTSLEQLSRFLDESHISGIRSAFDDIQACLQSITDPKSVNDPIYESELRSKMQALTNLLNDGARQIEDAEKAEFSKLSGKGTSEQGDVERVNNILEQIGRLNRQIKQNQIYNQPNLELMDERNVLLDELSSYVPIEVSYYKDYVLDGRHSSGLENDKGAYYYDSNNNPIGKRDWPDDLRVEMTYLDKDGKQQKMTLVEGTKGTGDDNIGRLEIVKNTDPSKNAEIDYPTDIALKFTGPNIDKTSTATPPPKEEVLISYAKAVPADPNNPNDTGKPATITQFPSNSGSIQASLDMLWKDGSTSSPALNDKNGYQYYMNQLDTLAQSFAGVMNTLNNLYETNKTQILLVDKTSTTQNGNGITAANIGISQSWINGDTHISMKGDNATDTVMNMLEAMSASYPYSKLKDKNGNILFDGKNNSVIGNQTTNDALSNMKNNTFADFINHVSTVLANDTYNNNNSLKTNVTVLNGIQDSRDSISGVSLDEEASNMMMYMSAYNAASRLMTTLDEALNTLINGTGVVGR